MESLNENVGEEEKEEGLSKERRKKGGGREMEGRVEEGRKKRK